VTTLTPLVESLALTVVMCEYDLRVRQAITDPAMSAWSGNVDHALTAATKRYLAACKMLAIAQKMNLPTVQVNIAENQVVANG
jgi:hypothetical protein